jgi:hypothetical protein
MIAEFRSCRFGFAGDDGVNSANFVADLPTYFKQVIGGKLGVVHRNIVLFVHKSQILEAVVYFNNSHSHKLLTFIKSNTV